MTEQHHDETEGVVLSHHEEPVKDELEPDEPRTPGWMPLLGGVLFLGATIFFVATQPPGKTTDELRRAAQTAAEEAAAKAAPPPAPAPEQQPGGAPQGAPGGGKPQGG